MAYEIRYAQRVLTALDSLKPHEQEKVREEIASLRDFSPSDPRQGKIKLLNQHQAIYVLETPEGLWVVFTPNESKRSIVIIDLTRPEALIGSGTGA